MMVGEASLRFNAVGDGLVDALSTPEKIADYVCDVFEEVPTVE